MQIEDFDYSFPEELIATRPAENSRVLWASDHPQKTPKEISIETLIESIPAGDAFVINETKVVKKKVPAKSSSGKDFDVVFLKSTDAVEWEVLFPLKKLKSGEELHFPLGQKAKLTKKGLPQKICFSEPLSEDFFQQAGKMPLPTYIEKQRQGDEKFDDESWYQTAWAKVAGSAAAPTASLHFKKHHIARLKERGVEVIPLCLHVGLGTFQPIQTKDIREHQMHKEEIFISRDSVEKLKGKKIWALGTTVVRSLESFANGYLKEDASGNLEGESDLYIYPGYKFRMVDHMLTNFHQPKSSLIAMVAAFAGLETVKRNYAWAVENRFRLFSYGDLSVWSRQ